MKQNKFVLIIFTLIFLISSCSPTNNINPSSNSDISTTDISPADLSEWGDSNKEKNMISDAYTMYLVQDEFFTNPADPTTQEEFTKLIKNANVLFYGTDDSQFLNMDQSSNSSSITRIKAAEILFYRHVELDYDIQYNGKSFRAQVNEILDPDPTWFLTLPNAGLVRERPDGSVGEFMLWDYANDFQKVEQWGDPRAVEFVTKAFNKLTAEKLMKYDDQNNFNPDGILSKKDAILLAYNYYYSLEPKPVYVNIDEVGTYDRSIITEELLEKTPSLPDASNQSLPNWRGFNLSYMADTTFQALGSTEEDWTTEAVYQSISETDANFIRLWMSFSRLAGPDYNSDEVNLYYLERLDQIIAWGIEYGLHIQISITNGPDMNQEVEMDEACAKTFSVFTDSEYQELMLRWWKMLARRYADIPNNYISFNFINEPDPPNEQAYHDSLEPIINAIWEESPDRVMVADIHGSNITGEQVAQLGVALSAHVYNPFNFCNVMRSVEEANPGYYESLSWPYYDPDTGKSIDANGILNTKNGLVSPYEVKATAEQNNVGFMIGEFGIFEYKGGTLFDFSIPRAEVYKMFTEEITLMNSLDIPWAANWVENYSIANTYPINPEATYEKLENSSYYIDTTMFEFFQKMIAEDGKIQ